MNQYLLTISMDGGEAVPCLPVSEDALGLNGEGITWLDKAVVSIRRDAQNELSVRAQSDMPVILERSGRRVSLEAREVRLLPKDVICFEGHRFEIVSMRRYRETKRHFSSRQAMLSAAAAFALMAVPACQPRNAGYPETPPQVEEHPTGDVAPLSPEDEAELQKLKEENAKAEAELKAELEDIEVPDVDKRPMGDVVAPVKERPEPELKDEVPQEAIPLPAGIPPAPPEIVPDCGCKDGEKCDCSETGKPCGCNKDDGEVVKMPMVERELGGKMAMPPEKGE